MWLLFGDFVTKGRGRPSLKELSKYIKDMSVKWKEIGIQLLSSESTLDIIEKDHEKVLSALHVAIAS